MCDCTPKNLKKYSKHDITICDDQEIVNYNWDDFDVVHVNGTIYKQFFTTKAKLIYNIHAYILSCPPGGLYCAILNKFLNKPLTCLDCLGYVGIKTGSDNQKNYIKMARKADIFAVHSEYLKNFYHTYNPTVFKVALEIDMLTPCDVKEKEDYIFYTGRLSFEKNPYGFIDIINKTGLKGKMAIYNFINEDVISTKSYYEDFFNYNKNIEIIINPSKEKMIDLVKRAKFTVLPYFFAEPLGIAPINSILCGTPVIAFPYGNMRNLTKLLPNTLEEMIQMVKMDDERYRYELKETLKKSDDLRKYHDPETVVKEWDEIYDKLCRA